HRAGTVNDAGGVASVMHVIDLLDLWVARLRFCVETQGIAFLDILAEFGERRRQRGEPFQSRVRTRVFVVFEDDPAVGIAHRNEAFLETAFLVSAGIPLLA